MVGVCHHIISPSACEYKSPEFFAGLSRMSPLRSSNPFDPGMPSLAIVTADFGWHLLKFAASSSANHTTQSNFYCSGTAPGLPSEALTPPYSTCMWAHTTTQFPPPTPSAETGKLRETLSHPSACVSVKTGVLKTSYS